MHKRMLSYEMQRVYCAVLAVFKYDSVFEGRAMAQAVSRTPLTAVRSQVSTCEICVGQRATGTGTKPGKLMLFRILESTE
jgi:hypothetical protein